MLVLPTAVPATAHPPIFTPGAGPKPSKQDRYVTYFEYQGEKIAKQRTPADKLKGGGASMVRELEALLDSGYVKLFAAPLEPLYTATQFSRIALVQLQVRAARPKWNHAAYELEVAFYQREQLRREALREQRRQQLVKESLEHQQKLALQAQAAAIKAERARDSVAQLVASRDQLQQDSLAVLAEHQEAQADSLARVAEAEASPTRFVNAARLYLRAEPSTSSTARAEVLVGSAVEVLRRLPSGWREVAVEGQRGYLKSEYLVTSLDAVTVPGADLDRLKENEGSAYVKRIPIRPQAQGSRKVYICDGQYAYAYHSTDYCAGLNNCRAQVFYTIERKARGMGRTPCARCFY